MKSTGAYLAAARSASRSPHTPRAQ